MPKVVRELQGPQSHAVRHDVLAVPVSNGKALKPLIMWRIMGVAGEVDSMNAITETLWPRTGCKNLGSGHWHQPQQQTSDSTGTEFWASNPLRLSVFDYQSESALAHKLWFVSQYIAFLRHSREFFCRHQS